MSFGGLGVVRRIGPDIEILRSERTMNKASLSDDAQQQRWWLFEFRDLSHERPTNDPQQRPGTLRLSVVAEWHMHWTIPHGCVCASASPTDADCWATWSSFRPVTYTTLAVQHMPLVHGHRCCPTTASSLSRVNSACQQLNDLLWGSWHCWTMLLSAQLVSGHLNSSYQKPA